MIEMSELKACPFCGSVEVSIWYQNVRYGRIAYAECDVCGAKSKAFKYYSQEKKFDPEDIGALCAFNAWNRRAGE